ncbi:FixH family protein [Metasolibacillus meyeri]|uniref:FixH family protein n=1 Tax=Metasolibacillus meyeri TaxID=1071052 RepID=A0AAW9NMP2_9BACL|nr:FixH family protein [Metasolibacillus meyeri]MEC1180109.1 FixH family protein [Metasolibacillus meyeri]
MKKWLLSLVAVPMILTGCNDEPEVDTMDSGVMPQEIVVEIQTPEEVAVNEEIDLVAYVTQGEEAVDDASVQFEVWESGLRDEGHMIDGQLDKDGVYKATFTFDHDGVYYMFAHTTARSLHVMPKQQIIAGNPDMSKVLEDKSDNSMNHGDHGEDEEDEDNHGHGH